MLCLQPCHREVAAVEKKYDREIEAAQGNAYMTKQLEKKKQQEVKKIKDEANRKMYAMEVMQALAQTATAAINAYSSAAAIPLVGYIIAPIAAAMAVAAGMVGLCKGWFHKAWYRGRGGWSGARRGMGGFAETARFACGASADRGTGLCSTNKYYRLSAWQ